MYTAIIATSMAKAVLEETHAQGCQERSSKRCRDALESLQVDTA